MNSDETMESLRARIAHLEAALSAAERRAQRIEEVIGAAPALMWESEGYPGKPGYRMVYVSGQIDSLLGYTREEWLENPMLWLQLIHPDDRAKIMQRAPQMDVDGSAADEHRFIAKDGREVWVEPHVRVVRDASGVSTGRRVFALDVSERHRAQEGRDALMNRLNNLVAGIPGAVWEAGDGTLAGLSDYSYISPYITTLSGYLPEEIIHNPKIWDAIVHTDDRRRIGMEAMAILAKGAGVLQYRWNTKDGRLIWVETHVRMNRDAAGAPVSACGVTMDITARKLAEAVEARLKDEVIHAQATILAELGTPLIPISSEVLVMPLIGAVDEQRSQRVLEALLHGIVKSRARVAIIDVTGVPSIDTHTADALLRAARAVRLLGAQVILTGIRAEVAQALVTLDVNVRGIVMCGTLESGIAYANRMK